MQKMLSLYNITLEIDLDEDLTKITCEDQLNFSWPYKEQFLLNKLEHDGIFKCNSVVKIVMVSIKDENKKMYPIFQTKYVTIRSPSDVTYFLRQSMVDIKSRIGKFTKKIDTKEDADQVEVGSDCIDKGIEYEKMNYVKIQMYSQIVILNYLNG